MQRIDSPVLEQLGEDTEAYVAPILTILLMYVSFDFWEAVLRSSERALNRRWPDCYRLGFVFLTQRRYIRYKES